MSGKVSKYIMHAPEQLQIFNHDSARRERNFHLLIKINTNTIHAYINIYNVIIY